MGPCSARISIDVPRERVYELLLDLAARPSFTDHLMEDYKLLREQPVGVGAGARFRIKDAGGWMDSIVAEVEPPHRIVERGAGGRLNRVPNVTEWRLIDTAGASGCEVEVTFWTEPSHPYDRLQDARNSERRLTRALKRVLERLRELAEAGAPPERVTIAGGDRI